MATWFARRLVAWGLVACVLTGCGGGGDDESPAGSFDSGADAAGSDVTGPQVDARPDVNGNQGDSSVDAGADGNDGAIPTDASDAADAGSTPASPHLEISPAGAILLPGESAVFTARLLDGAGTDAGAGAITWEKNGDVVTLTPGPGNQVTVAAGTAIDSVQLVARAGDLRSPPVTVSVARLVNGARHIRDEDVLSDTSAIDASQTGTPGSRVHVVLAGEAPTVGQILVGSGKQVAGKVVSSTPAAGGNDVVLEVVPLDELFQDLRLQQSYDLRGLPMTFPSGPPSKTVVRQDGLTTYEFAVDIPATGPPKQASCPNNPGGTCHLRAPGPGDFMLGLMYCSMSGSVAPEFDASQISASFTPNFPAAHVDILIGSGTSSLRVLTEGAIEAKVHGPLRLNTKFEGSLLCQLPAIQQPFPIPPPVALLVLPMFVAGPRIEANGKILLNTLELLIDAEASQPVKLGFEVSSTGTVTNLSELDTSQLDKKLEPKLTSTTLNAPVRVEASLEGSFYAQATLTNPFYMAWCRFKEKYPYKSMIDLQSGLKAELVAGTVIDQITDPNFKTGYNIKFRTRFGLGADATEVIGWISKLLGFAASKIPDLTFEPLLFSHPIGGALTYLNGYQYGDQVHYKVLLDPDFIAPSLLGYYNVRRVEIWRKNSTGGADLLVGRDALDGEKEFDFDWAADQGGVVKDNVVAVIEPVFGEGLSFKLDKVVGWSKIKQFGGGNDQVGRTLSIDPDGRIAVAGYTLDGFGGQTAAGADMEWLQINPVGAIVGGSLYGGAGDDIPMDMKRAPDGSYYVTGYSWGGDFTGKGAPASVYAWLIKLDATGKKVWAEQWAGTGAPYGYTQEMGRSLALGPNGEIYVGGLVGSTLGGNATAYSCPEPIHDGTGTDCGDVVLSSWEDLGIQAKRNWRTVKPNKGYQTSASIAADTGGNIILVGGTYGDTKDDKSPGNEDTSLGLADPNRYKVGGGVWVFDSAGGVQSSDYVKIDAQDLGLNGVAYDNAGNAIIVGGTTGAFDGWTNQGGGDFFVMQRPGTGTGGWVKMFGSAGDDNAGPLYIGPSGDIYVGGTTTGLLYAAPSGNLDAFVTHLDPNGDQVLAGGQPLAVQFGGAGNDRPWEIGFDRYKNVFVCGTTDGKLGEGLTLSFGGRDIFVAKLGPGFNLQ